jgi:predicted ester cyclase
LERSDFEVESMIADDAELILGLPVVGRRLKFSDYDQLYLIKQRQI